MKYSAGNQHIPTQGIFEDDFPFPKVGYASSLEGIFIYTSCEACGKFAGGGWESLGEAICYSRGFHVSFLLNEQLFGTPESSKSWKLTNIHSQEYLPPILVSFHLDFG